VTNFHSIYSHGFIRGAVCLPHVRVADPTFNTVRTLALAQRASEANAALASRKDVRVAVLCCPWPQYRDVRFAPGTAVVATWDLSAT